MLVPLLLDLFMNCGIVMWVMGRKEFLAHDRDVVLFGLHVADWVDGCSS